ncbi:hypothetical protein ES703_111355 [subsurface metagenome]
MKNNQNTQTSVVRRITIDERLADDLIRILIADLKDGVTTFDDDSAYWGEEEEFLVQPDNYRDKIGMTRDNARKWLWNDLHEGQVFLLGRFRVNRNRRAQAMFVVDMKRRNFRRIDSLVKDWIKRKYLAALERSIPDGETNQTR